MSSYTRVLCGVPKGPCLGPPLFRLYINDIPLISNFDTTLFADDTGVMMTDNNLKNLEHKVQIELKKVNSWLCQNKLYKLEKHKEQETVISSVKLSKEAGTQQDRLLQE